MFETMINIKPTKKIYSFVKKYFYYYVGPMNLEMIDDNFIEGHLRFNGNNYAVPEKIFKKTSILMHTGYFNSKLKKYNRKEYIFPVFCEPKYNPDFEKILKLIKGNVLTYRFNKDKNSYTSPGGKRYVIFNTLNKKEGIKIKKK